MDKIYDIELPLEIIDKIFISNPSLIISTYRNYLLNSTKVKKLKTISTRVDISLQSNLFITKIDKYIQDEKTMNKYFKHSNWYKYWYSGNTNNSTNHQEIISTIMYEFSLLENILNRDNVNADNINIAIETFQPLKKSITSKKKKLPEYNELLLKFENLINTNEIVYNDNITIYLNRFREYYNLSLNGKGFEEIPQFIKLIIILVVVKYFTTSRIKININESLEYILNNDKQDLDNEVMYIPPVNITPLFTIPIGMGYSFILSWDLSINRMIGYIWGGSDGNEYEFNKNKLENYSRSSIKMKLKKNKFTMEQYLQLLTDTQYELYILEKYDCI